VLAARKFSLKRRPPRQASHNSTRSCDTSGSSLRFSLLIASKNRL
jgi:hypothetical protein